MRGKVHTVSVNGCDCSCTARYKFPWGPDIIPGSEANEALKIIIAGSLVEQGLDRWPELKRNDAYNKCGQNSGYIKNLLDEHCPQDYWGEYVRKAREIFANPWGHHGNRSSSQRTT